MDLPYSAEYAKSSRSNCRGCKTTILKEVLRLAVMVQSPFHDGKTAQWYHFDCFFNKQRPKTTDDINNFEQLRVEDQDKIKKKVDTNTVAIVPSKKGKKRNAAEEKIKKQALKDFKIEYAKSGKAMCRGCEQKILKDVVRISKKDFDTEIGKKFGGQDMWHHVTCFAQVRSDLGFFESGDKLPGFETLKPEDQKEVKKHVVPIKQEEVPVKKPKKEDDVDGAIEKEKEKEYREQNKIMYKYRDGLKKLENSELVSLLENNKQTIPSGKDNMLDLIADIMTFGALKPCTECEKGQFVFSKGGYTCTGDLTEWTKCTAFVKEPKRKPFKVPSALKSKHSFLKSYKYVARVRIIKSNAPSTSVKKEENEEAKEPKVKRELPPLYDMQFVIIGKPPKGKDEIKKQIEKMGGKVVTKLSDSIMAVISTQAEVEKMSSRMQAVETEQIHVVPDDFLDEAEENVGKIPDLILKKSICDWGADPTARLPKQVSTKSKSQSIYTKSVPSKIKLQVKGGSAVDPDSGLEDRAHVYREGATNWTVILGLTDIQLKKNSYYKLQLLESDQGQHYWLFRSWGRIGTTIGGNKLEKMYSLIEGKSMFKFHYEDKSGNKWENHKNFIKIPGKMYPIDVDYGEEDSQKFDIVQSESKLPVPVQDLIKMIFDVNAMKKLMLEFELDTEKMPLGKLSKAQIQKAYSVLTELQGLIEKNESGNKLIDASNRFYTFIPHSFGIEDPPILDKIDVIKQKIDMLENLMELEIAYNLMKTSGSEHTVDSYYHQLNTEINVLDKNSEEFAIISEYLKNTHAQTHTNYKLEIDEVFVIKRSGEDKRYKAFKKLHNKKLLWHGSRVTNFAGILSQGLRIAPPEAPVTGYMFGKGIYFADMVSKSANYCCTNAYNPTGLMLLCEVALGDMFENLHANMIQKLPPGKHSCKGVGKTQPDPAGSKFLDKVEVPLGKPVQQSIPSSLLYNEFIVYDVAQVNIKYLLKVNFKFSY